MNKYVEIRLLVKDTDPEGEPVQERIYDVLRTDEAIALVFIEIDAEIEKVDYVQ